MSGAFAAALGFSLAAAAVNLAGLYVIRRFEAWGRAKSVLFAAFAAGVVVTAALVHLIPRALAMAPGPAPFFLLGGYLVMYLLGRLLAGAEHASHEERRVIAILPLIGIAVHSFVDGIVYSVAFTVDTFTGILAVAGLTLHEFPEGIFVFILLLRGGFRASRAFWLAALAAALTTPLGMLASWPFISDLEGAPLGSVLAATAGGLIYVGASHLVPHVEHETGRGSGRAFAAGIAASLAALALHHF